MNFNKLFNKNIISIDIGSFETKITEGKENRDGIAINKAFSFHTPSDSYENGYIRDMPLLLDVTKEELKKNKLSSGICHLNLKSTAVITREILFPILSDKEIDGLLKYQLGEYLPMDESKYIIQHKILGRVSYEGNEKQNVLVVAMPKDMVDMHYAFVKELGLKPYVLDYQPNGLWKLFNFIDYLNDSMNYKNKTIAAIDLGYSSTNIVIMKNGVLQTSRTIDAGGIHLDNNAANLIALTSEELLVKKREISDVSSIDGGYSDYNRYVNIVKTSLEGIMDRIDKVFKYFISKEAENEIQGIILYGGLSNIKGVEKLFNNYFNISTVLINSIGRINMKQDVDKYINCIASLIRDDEV